MACREETVYNEIDDCLRPCNNIWLESDRCAFCLECKTIPLYIDIHKQIPGYWCPRCDKFTNLNQNVIKIEHV
jgi:hypothetical protein